MDITLRADSANGTHTRFTIFMNGGNCGELCMREDEAVFFHHLVTHSNWLNSADNIVTKGRWTKEKGGLCTE